MDNHEEGSAAERERQARRRLRQEFEKLRRQHSDRVWEEWKSEYPNPEDWNDDTFDDWPARQDIAWTLTWEEWERTEGETKQQFLKRWWREREQDTLCNDCGHPHAHHFVFGDCRDCADCQEQRPRHTSAGSRRCRRCGASPLATTLCLAMERNGNIVAFLTTTGDLRSSLTSKGSPGHFLVATTRGHLSAGISPLDRWGSPAFGRGRWGAAGFGCHRRRIGSPGALARIACSCWRTTVCSPSEPASARQSGSSC